MTKNKASTLDLLHAIRHIPISLISSLEKHVLTVFLSCINTDNETWYSMESIADFACLSYRSIRRYVKRLEQKRFIFVNRPSIYTHRSTNQYSLNAAFIMSFSVDKSEVSVTPDMQVGGQRDPQSEVSVTPDRGSGRPIKRKDRGNKEERESARTKRAPLPASFYPDQKLSKLTDEIAAKVGMTGAHLIQKFKNICASKEKTSANWLAEYENFLLNERPRLSAVSRIGETKKQETAYASVVNQSTSVGEVVTYLSSPSEPEGIIGSEEMPEAWKRDIAKRKAERLANENQQGALNEQDAYEVPRRGDWKSNN